MNFVIIFLREFNLFIFPETNEMSHLTAEEWTSLVEDSPHSVSTSLAPTDPSYLVAVAEHGREDRLQQGQDVFVRLEQTAHRLQLDHAAVRPLGDWQHRDGAFVSDEGLSWL